MSEFKKDTIEEVARKYANISHNRPLDEEERYFKDYQKYDGFVAGAKWQKEQINCELSELLEQRNEMLAMLEDVVNLFKRGEFDTDENIGGRQLIKANQLIKKSKRQ